MSSQELSACYPQRTFYPLIDAKPTRKHRITMTNNFVKNKIISATPARVTVKQFTKTITFLKTKLVIKQLPLYTSVTL